MSREAAKCVTCNDSSYECKCEIPNYISNVNKVIVAYADLYKEIAKQDSMHPMQNPNDLIKKSEMDFSLINRDSSMKKILRKQNSRILEIGPGLGHLANLFLDKNLSYYATDIVSTYLEKIESPTFLANVEHLPKLDFYFDLIVACDVFEHVLNEGDAAISVYESLNDGGAFFMRTPYCEPLINYATKLGAPFPFVHLRSYQRQNLVRLVKSAGFNRVKIKYRCDAPMSWSRRTLFKGAHMNSLRKELEMRSSDSHLRFQGNVSASLFKFQVWIEAYALSAMVRIVKPENMLYRATIRIFFRPNEIICIAVK